MANDHIPEESSAEPSEIEAAGAIADPEQPPKVVRRPPLDQLLSRPVDLFKRQLSIAEQVRAFVGGSAAEQARKALTQSASEQMRQIHEVLNPFHGLQDTVGQMAKALAQSPLQHFLDEQASMRRQAMEAMRPTWNQTLIGHALNESINAIHTFRSLQQAEVFRTQQAIVEQFGRVSALADALKPKLPSFQDLVESWRHYPARVKENLVALAEAGWYLDAEMDLTDIIYFKEELENGTIEEINEELAQHFHASLDRIEQSLCADHPTRAHLIKDAFAAHRDGKYSLSIPALFAQADGICFDLTGQQIFSGNGIYRFAKRIDPSTLERAYLEPLLRAIPITSSSRQQRTKIPQLNRHAVMHGESTDFPSEHNSLKAISFVNFVSHVLGMAVSSLKELAPESDEIASSRTKYRTAVPPT